MVKVCFAPRKTAIVDGEHVREAVDNLPGLCLTISAPMPKASFPIQPVCFLT